MLRLNALARPPEMVTVRQKRHPRITGEGTVQLCAHLDLFNVGSWKVGVLSPIKMVWVLEQGGPRIGGRAVGAVADGRAGHAGPAHPLRSHAWIILLSEANETHGMQRTPLCSMLDTV
nr:hypothetical protein Iba_scaffold8277CG0010 [Ipomoea batatas]